jgi:hypothetical protein
VIATARERTGLAVSGHDLTTVPNSPKAFQDIALIARNQDDMLLCEAVINILGDMRGLKPILPQSPQDRLLRAAIVNNIPMMAAAIADGADVNQPIPIGWTALFNAAANTRIEAMDYLVRTAQANVDAQDVLDRTPLIYAALNGNSLSVRKLLKLGANPFVPAHDGKTARELVESLQQAMARDGRLTPEVSENFMLIATMLSIAEEHWARHGHAPARSAALRQPVLH